MFESDERREAAAGKPASCSGGAHTTHESHEAATHCNASGMPLAERAVESAVIRALFPRDAARRRFLKAVGAGTAMAAIASLFPLARAKEAFAQDAGKIEKARLKVGFIPITCATPIIMAHPRGYYAKQGLDVTTRHMYVGIIPFVAMQILTVVLVFLFRRSRCGCRE